MFQFASRTSNDSSMSSASASLHPMVIALQAYMTTKEKLERHMEELKVFFADKNLRKTENLEMFKAFLRTALNHDHKWNMAAPLKHAVRTPAEEEMWQDRETIRKYVNRKAKEIIQEVFGITVSAKDGEDAPAVRRPGISVAVSTPSSTTSSIDGSLDGGESSGSGSRVSAYQVLAKTSKRVRVTTKPFTPEVGGKGSQVPKHKHDSFDGMIRIGDFKPVPRTKKHLKRLAQLRALANQMSVILEEIGSSWDEWFIDGQDTKKTKIRFLALKHEYIENIKFREYAPLPSESPAPGSSSSQAATVPPNEAQAASSESTA